MNKFKCSCGLIIESNKNTGVKCSCGKVACRKLIICPTCKEEKFLTNNSINCKECSIKVRVEKFKTNEKRFKRAEDSFDVPIEYLKGREKRIQQIVKYNWWSNNDFALKVSKCKTVEEAEKMLDELNRYYVNAHYISSKGYAIYR